MVHHETLTITVTTGQESKSLTLENQVIEDFMEGLSDEARANQAINWIKNALRITFQLRMATDERANAYIAEHVTEAD